MDKIREWSKNVFDIDRGNRIEVDNFIESINR